MRESMDSFAQPTEEERAQLKAISEELSKYDMSNPLNKAAQEAGYLAGSPIRLVGNMATRGLPISKIGKIIVNSGTGNITKEWANKQIEKSE